MYSPSVPILKAGQYLSPEQDVFSSLASVFMPAVVPPFSVGLYGDLGAGKTTFVRHILRASLPGERIKSPTYALVEPYPLPQMSAQGVSVVYHFDFYRLATPAALMALDLEAYFHAESLCFVEWPDVLVKGTGHVFDLVVHWRADLVHQTERPMDFYAHTPAGVGVLTQLTHRVPGLLAQAQNSITPDKAG